MSQLTDNLHLVFQDHRKKIAIHQRALTVYHRLENRDQFGRYSTQGDVLSTDPLRGWGHGEGQFLISGETVKDMGGVFHVAGSVAQQSFGIDNRNFTTGPPQPTSTVSYRPIFTPNFAIDTRFKEQNAFTSLLSGYPKGTPGLVVKTTSSSKQEELFFPSTNALVAAQSFGQFRVSNLVYDITQFGEHDELKRAPLHTLTRVVKMEPLPGRPILSSSVNEQSILALQLFKSEGDRAPCGFMYTLDTAGGRVLAMETRRSGPFHSGRRSTGTTFDKHHQGFTTNAAEDVLPLHLSTEAYFMSEQAIAFFDGPKKFYYELHKPRGFQGGEFVKEVKQLWDKDKEYEDNATGKKFKGMWVWETIDAITYIKPPSGPTGGGGAGSLPPGEAPPPEKGFRSLKIGQSKASIIETFDGRAQLLPTFAANVRMGAGVTFSAFATNTGEIDTTRGTLGDDGFQVFNDLTTDVAALVPFALGTGQWKGFKNLKNADKISAARGQGGIMLVPPRYRTPFEVERIFAGFYGSGGNGTAETQAILAIPENLAALDFARPTNGWVTGKSSTGSPTVSGVRLEQSGGAGLKISFLDTTGSKKTTPRIDIGESSFDIVTSILKVIEDGNSFAEFRGIGTGGTVDTPTISVAADIMRKDTAYGHDGTVLAEAGRTEWVVDALAANVGSIYQVVTQDKTGVEMTWSLQANGQQRTPTTLKLNDNGSFGIILDGSAAATSTKTASLPNKTGIVVVLDQSTITADPGPGLYWHRYLCDSSGAAFTFTLPTAASNTQAQIILKDHTGSCGTNAITIATTGGQTVDGNASGVVKMTTAYEVLTFISDGTNWFIGG